MKKTFLACVLAAVVAAGDEVASSNSPVAVILLSGSNNGILRSCYCPNNPWGGLARRAWLVDEVRRTVGDDRVLLLDSGDLLPGEDDPDRIPVLARLYGLMRYDGVVAGEQDWPALTTAGAPVSVPKGGIRELPWRAVGCMRAGERTSALPGVLYKTVGGVRVAVLPLVGAEAFKFAGDRAKGFQFADPLMIVREFVAKERGQSDLLVVLSHQGLEADRSLAAQISGVDLILGGHSQDLVHPPEVVNGIPIFQPGKNGENLAVLMVFHNESGSAGMENARVVSLSVPRMSPAGVRLQDPFASAVTRTPHFTIHSRLVPLDEAMGENAVGADWVDAYYRAAESRFTERIRVDMGQKTNGPRILAIGQEGEGETASITVTNFGNAPVLIEKVRSKVPWLAVEAFPKTVGVGESGSIRFRVSTTNLSGRYRGEYTIWNNDANHRIYPGSVSGVVPEGRRARLDVGVTLKELGTITAPLIAEPRPATGAAGRGSVPVVLTSEGRSAILVEFFTSAGCDECEEVKTRILPDLKREFDGVWTWQEYDVNVRSNYVHLARLQERHKVRTNARTSVWVDGTVHFDGVSDIRKGLAVELRRRLSHPVGGEPHRVPAEVSQAAPSPAPTVTQQDDGDRLLAERLRRWSGVGMAVAGALDGLNPCAFATVVFMASLLAMAGRRSRDVLVMGAMFTVASYVTYFGLGFGALQVFQKFGLWRVAGDALRWGMVLVLGVLAVLSWRDAWRFTRYGQSDAISLQVPGAIKQRVHGILRARMGTGGIMVGALLAGSLVTLLESVCTGQIYVPTLVFLARDPMLGGRALWLLALYNLFFIIPLIVVIIAVWWGTRSPQLADWSHRNVAPSKVLMGLLFAVMALILLRLRA
jgi:hypothetical protein